MSATATLASFYRSCAEIVMRKLGGAERTRVILILAAVLGLSSADASTVGASASPLRHSLGINNTDI
ncbi:MAG TPA: hypothetical protein VFJ95_14495, partial [Gammaproteobacteria bacterium]|nr:hypothetical protein [Gammaproteobacteria bacterium]